ncbi:MAG: GNAT family N-acetyltransferase [Clostridia bacterium]|nr:GNAT family N-acetyltransferase [Clostridia bacterium]
MPYSVIPVTPETTPAAVSIWNRVVEDGVAFPQTEPLTLDAGAAFFAEQTLTAVAVDEDGTVLGMYILHPNNVGRCGHIANASYAVARHARGQGVGEALVRDSLKQAKAHGFRVMQFNAVVATNTAALHLYEKVGFTRLGVIPKGFRLPDGTYADIVPQYIEL